MAATIDHPFLDGRTKLLLIGGAWQLRDLRTA